MTEVLTKLLSRKLWVTLFTIAAVVLGGGQADGVDPTRVTTIISTTLAALYVIVQGLIDRAKEKAKASTALSPEAKETLLRLTTLVKQSAAAASQPTTAGPIAPSTASTLKSASITSIAALGLGATLCVAGCATLSSNERPACSEAALAQLETQYASEMLSACSGQDINSCKQAEAIEDAHQERLEQWAQCQ